MSNNPIDQFRILVDQAHGATKLILIDGMADAVDKMETDARALKALRGFAFEVFTDDISRFSAYICKVAERHGLLREVGHAGVSWREGLIEAGEAYFFEKTPLLTGEDDG